MLAHHENNHRINLPIRKESTRNTITPEISAYHTKKSSHELESPKGTNADKKNDNTPTNSRSKIVRIRNLKIISMAHRRIS